MTAFSTPVAAHPFIKWAGGKRQLIPAIEAVLPAWNQAAINYYGEPFVGGGAVLFHLLSSYPTVFQEVHINDVKPALMTTYKQVQTNVTVLIQKLQLLEKTYLPATEETRKQLYYQWRDTFNTLLTSSVPWTEEEQVNVATLFIALNHTCFNGLYRVNSKGAFNVPHGKYKNPLICDSCNLQACSDLLQKVILHEGNYQILNDVFSPLAPHLFLYVDPPYRPLSTSASFNSYDKSSFNDTQQQLLATWLMQQDAQGTRWLLSNSDPHNSNPDDDFFDDLYHNCIVQRVTATRAINSKGTGRGAITELLIRNYR